MMLLNTMAFGHITAEQVKAHYIYNFTKFTRWPEGKKEKLNVCFSSDSQRKTFEEVTSKTSQKGKFTTADIDSTDITKCQVIMLSKSMRASPEFYLDQIKNLPILTISDMDKFASRRGGIIELVPLGNTIRFSVSIENAKKQGNLELSFRLLEIAINVWREDEN